MPLGSVADHLTRTGAVVLLSHPVERTATGAAMTGGRPSVTTRFRLVVRVSPPPWPVIVSGNVPTGVTGAAADDEIVRPADDPVAGLGLKAALAPAGRPPTSSLTGSVKFVRAIPIVAATPRPCF